MRCSSRLFVLGIMFSVFGDVNLLSRSLLENLLALYSLDAVGTLLLLRGRVALFVEVAVSSAEIEIVLVVLLILILLVVYCWLRVSDGILLQVIVALVAFFEKVYVAVGSGVLDNVMICIFLADFLALYSFDAVNILFVFGGCDLLFKDVLVVLLSEVLVVELV